jgi:hypothetical protein
MSLAKLVTCTALVTLLVACSGDEEEALPTRTLAPSAIAESTQRVFPTATPLPAAILNDGCPVTAPNGSTPPGEDPDRSGNVLGNGAIWVGLYPEGTVVFEPDGQGGRDPLDGSYSMKFGWWRGVEGRLEITGRRLDADAPPMWGEVPDGYGDHGFQATGLVFPTEGCWQVTGRVGDATITFVTRVVSTYPPFESRRIALADCPMTPPNGSTPPGESPNNAHHGNGDIWTVLWPDGTVVFEPEGPGTHDLDGSLRVKWPFWRSQSGALVVHGFRLDEHAPAVRAMIVDGYGDTGLQPAVLVFPTPGCWQITAGVGDAALVFVTLVESRY